MYKKSYNKLISMILLTCILLTFGGSFMSSAGGNTVLLYKEDNLTREKMDGDSVGIQFKASKHVESIELFVAKSTGGKGTFTASLYKWNQGFGITQRGTAIKTQRFENVDNAEWVKFDCNVDSGEYVVIFSDFSGSVQLRYSESIDNTRLYFNASVWERSLEAKINFKEAGGELLPVSEDVQDFVESQTTWVAVDGLGRVLDNTYEDTTRENKTVGLFFHTWHDSNSTSGSLNITKILKEHPEIQNDYKSPLWGHSGNYHWNEPLWGYYKTSDEWVLRRQAELLADAGVDVVIFDNTNGTVTFIDAALTLCKVWAEARADGIKTPQISFMLPMFEYNDAAVQLRELYKELYGKGLYKDLWFYWKGKPLMVGYPGRLDERDETDKEIINFFTYRVISHSQSQDNIQTQLADGTPQIYGATPTEVTSRYQLWNWISVYPQLVNKNADGTPEEVAVAIAHNWCAETHLTAMNNNLYQVFGRHYRPSTGTVDTRENAKLYGAYFEEQWEYALDIDPEFVWITGWNEGVAGRFEDFLGIENAFPDNFSDEYSRDIEPSKGDLKDHYYYQMVSYIRKYKGQKAATVGEKATIDISTGNGWEKVNNVYESYEGDVFDRDSKGYLNKEDNQYFYYTDSSGRNDLVSSKACYDDDFVYFKVETKDNITPYSDSSWMRLYLSLVDKNGCAINSDSFEGFQYVINRTSPTETKATLEKSKGGSNWEIIGEVDYTVSGNILQIKVPRELIGILNTDFILNFKWADNCNEEEDILNLYTQGDTAPVGRFMYQLCGGEAPEKETKKKGCGSIVNGMGAIGAAAACGILVKKKEKKQ